MEMVFPDSGPPTTGKKARVYALVAGIIIGTLAIAVWAARQGAERKARLTSEAPATVTRYESDDDYDTVHYTYIVDGATYSGEETLSTRWYSEGDSVKVCYDPANAKDSRLVEADDRCG